MKQFLNIARFWVAVASLAVIAACASTGQGTRDMAVAAGFRVITPTTEEQKALLPTLPEGQITQINHEGKIYYVLPDVANNQAYVGGPAQYQAFQQLRIARQISNDNLAAAQMNQMNQMNWGMWGGWGAPGWRGPGGFGH